MILEKNYQTLYSSMMGHPDLRPQLVKVRTRKTRPQRNRKDEILGNLVLSLTSSWVSWAVNITDQTWDITPFRNRQNWWEPLPTTVRSIGPNDTVPKTVISYCQNRRLTWREMTVPWVCYKSTDLQTRWVLRTSIHFSFKENSQRY